jgi:hypothetical protein
VMVAGEWRKRNGQLLFQDLERVKSELYRSGSRILGELNWRPEPEKTQAYERVAKN